MPWTERAEIKTDYEEIIAYLENENCFHDYRIGYIDCKDKEVQVTIEEQPGSAAGLVWNFHFRNVTSFEMAVDAARGFWITEVGRGEIDNEIQFDLDNGMFAVAAEIIKFGIPSPIRRTD